MDQLLQELTADGTLDAAGVRWAEAYQADHGGPLDSVLLELDLVTEPALLRALQSGSGMPAASPADLERADPTVAQRFPQGFSKSFSMCPVRLDGSELVALVEGPLPSGWVQELRELFGLELRQLVAPSHYLELAKHRVYGTTCSERTEQLEARLGRRRSAPEVSAVLSGLGQAASLGDAVAQVLDYASYLVEACWLVMASTRSLQVAGWRGSDPGSTSLPLPAPACTLRPAIVHGGYFYGPLAGTQADREFFAALGRSLPACAFVAPVPAASSGALSLVADNGPRSMPNRFVAELSLLVARLGQRGGPRSRVQADAGSDASEPRAVAEPAPGGPQPSCDEAPSQASMPPPVSAAPDSNPALARPAVEPALPQVTPEEYAVLQRLRQAATVAGQPLGAFVEELLQGRVAPTGPEASSAMVAEVKGLFERLATDIPTHLARGMESAFRELVPHLATAPAAPAPGPAPPSPAASAAASVGLVVKEAAPKEVASYRARRKKSTRVKL